MGTNEEYRYDRATGTKSITTRVGPGVDEFALEHILTQMVKNHPKRQHIPGAWQVMWKEKGYTNTITVFDPSPQTDSYKRSFTWANDITWVGNVRVSRTQDL